MKRLVCLAVVSALLIGGGVGLYNWSPKFRAMVKKVNNGADELIGPDQVKREKIALHLKKLDAAIERLDDEQANTEIQAKHQEGEIKKQEARISDAETALVKVKDGLTTVSKSETVSINGRDYNKTKLEAVGQSIVAKHKDWSTELKSQKDNLQRLQDRAARFKTRKEELAKEVVGLQKDLKAIDDKMNEIEDLKRASSAMGDADKTVGDNLENLKKEVAELDSSLDRRLNKEDRAWDKVGKSGGDEGDKFIEASKSSSSPDTLSEIDAILKGKK